MDTTVRLIGVPVIAVRFALLWTVLLWPAVSFGAQPAGIDNLLTGYSLTSWSIGVGEPLGSVYAIVQDDVGYLWLGSDAGLLRFDGANFTAWDEIGDGALPAVAVRALTLTRNGRLWVGLADGGGIGVIQDGHLRMLTAGLSGAGDVTALAEDQRGTMWAVSDRALYVRRDDRWERVTLPWTNGEGTVFQVFVSSSGSVFVGTRWGVFHRTEHADRFEHIVTGPIWGFSEDADKTIWTTDSISGFRRLAAPMPPQRILESSGYRLMHDSKDNLWVASFGQGLWRVPRGDGGAPDSRVAERATLRTGLGSDSVQSMFEDRNGNMWVGTTGGLHRLRQRPLTPLEHVGFVATVEPASMGRMWAGTPDGLVQLTADPGTQQRIRLGAARPDIRIFHSGSDGTLWVGATDGLWRYARGELARMPIAIRPLSISADRRGTLWLRDDSWLYRYDGRNAARFDAVQSTTPGFAKITFARADRTGRLWVGFAGGQLGYLRDDGQFETLGPSQGWSTDAHGIIHAAFEGSDGTVWFGGSGGLSRFEGGRMSTVSQRNGLPGNQVWAITEDDRHHLWLSLDRGLIHLDSKEVAKALADPSYRMRYRLFDAADGVAGAAVGAIGIVKANDGTLWFVRGGGVTLMSAADSLAIEQDTLETAQVRIESATADMHRFRPAPQTLFPAGTTRLQINYTALTLAASNQIRFRYRLDGFDEDWVDAGTRRTAFYTNMSPRTYAFIVEASSQDGIWTSSTATWNFTIQPAFYQTRAFFALCAALAVLTVGAAWRLRLSWIHQRFALVLEERARLSREIHDTLLQSLVGVALQLDAVTDLVGRAPSSAGEQLVRIRRQVEAYIREARQSIWDLRSPHLDAQDLIKVLRGIGRDAVTNSSVRFAASIKGAPRRYPQTLENQLRRIGQEAITNAVRHAGATRIDLELHFDEHAVGLRVEDDGRGFEYPALEAKNHYGLTTMRERTEALRGEFRISTGPGRGTVIEAVVPTTQMSRNGESRP